MCGIIYGKRAKGRPVAHIIEEAYHKQKIRGQEGFGYVVVENGIARVERDVTEKGILEKLRSEMSDEILFHHRKPTSTANYEFCTHPIYVSNDRLQHDYLVVHNGVIQTPDSKRLEHVAEGYVYTTEHTFKSSVYRGNKLVGEGYSTTKYNDSETLAVELARFEEELIDRIDLAGSIAFIMFKLEKKTGRVVSRIWGHNTGNPLYKNVVKKRRGGHMLIHSHSEGYAIPTGRYYWVNYDNEESEYSIEIDIGSTHKTYKYNVGYKHSLPPPKTNQQNYNAHRITEKEHRQIADRMFDDSYYETMQINAEINVTQAKLNKVDEDLTEYRNMLIEPNLDKVSEIAIKAEVRDLEIEFHKLTQKLEDLEEDRAAAGGFYLIEA